MGTLKNFKLQLLINQNITPVQQPICRLPYHTKQKVSDELQRLQKFYHRTNTRKNNMAEPCCSKPVLKPNGKIRLCLDMWKANVATE